MKKICFIFLGLTFFINSAQAGRVTTSPIIGQSDKIISTSIKRENALKYYVLAKTQFETFSIAMDSYAGASALAADLKKPSMLHCKTSSRLRSKPITNCTLVEVTFSIN